MIGMGVCVYCALIMVSIGAGQWKSEKPVGFYTGEKPLSPGDVTDVKKWNHLHGGMMMIYGGLLLIAGAGFLLPDERVGAVLFFALVLLPLPGMMLYHKRLCRIYRTDGKDS